jgi:hypothetical protein
MPTPRSGGAWGTDGRRIYVAGGEVTTKELVGAFRAVEAYEPATNSWISLPPMPMPRHGIAGAVIGNELHLVSGMIQSAGALTFLDPRLEVHTGQHDVLELNFFFPTPTTGAKEEALPSTGAKTVGAASSSAAVNNVSAILLPLAEERKRVSQARIRHGFFREEPHIRHNVNSPRPGDAREIRAGDRDHENPPDYDTHSWTCGGIPLISAPWLSYGTTP